MPNEPLTGEDTADPDPRSVRDRVDLARALLLLKVRSNLSYRRLERVTAEAPGARFGLPFTTIRDYLQGRSLPTADRLDQIVWACRVTDPESRAEWARALRRAVDAGSQAPAEDPYPGASAYDVDDVDRFSGRARLTAELLNRIQALDATGGLLAVVGASGAGTTSLLRAGLVAVLRRDDPTRAVRYGTPGADPTGRLAELLGAPGTAGAPRPVLVIDQLDQLFAAPAPARAAFLAMLGQAVAEPGAPVIVLGLRPGLLAPARAALPGVLEGEFAVRPMTADELRGAIVEPAASAGRTVADGLVELLLHELRPGRGEGPPGAAHAPGVLPLLGMALSATWNHATGGELTVAGYRAGGGLDGAVARTAEAVWSGLSGEQQRVARAVFLRLVRTAADVEPSRRRATTAELDELPGATAVVERLVDGRVLTAVEDAVDITHEALLHAWPRLLGWLDEDRSGHAVRGLLVESARRWQDNDRDDGFLLKGTPLAEAVEWAAGSTGDELLSSELGYLRASLARESTENAAQQARIRRLRVAVVVLAVLAVAMAGLTTVVLLDRPDDLATVCIAPTEPPTGPPADGG